VGLTSPHFLGEKESNKKRELCGEAGVSPKGIRRHQGGAFMKTLIHLKRHGDGYFHVHPLHAMLALVASFVLAVLIVLVLVSSVR
jgi:hypothetical protein